MEMVYRICYIIAEFAFRSERLLFSYPDKLRRPWIFFIQTDSNQKTNIVSGKIIRPSLLAYGILILFPNQARCQTNMMSNCTKKLCFYKFGHL